MENITNPRLFSFIGGIKGDWEVESVTTIVGDTLPAVSHINIVQGDALVDGSTGWILRGVTSNERYTMLEEKERLVSKQAALGNPHSNLAALIPIRKNAKW